MSLHQLAGGWISFLFVAVTSLFSMIVKLSQQQRQQQQQQRQQQQQA